MVFISSLAGTHDFKCFVDFDLLECAESLYGAHVPFCSAEFEAYGTRLREDFFIPCPQSAYDALLLYFLVTEDISILATEV